MLAFLSQTHEGDDVTRDVAAEAREIDAAIEGQTVCGLFQDAVAKFADAEALKVKGRRRLEVDLRGPSSATGSATSPRA